MAELLTSAPKPNPVAARLHISCGDCVFYNSLRLPNASAPCSGLGCAKSRAPCRMFSPNVFTDEAGLAVASKPIRDALNSIPDVALGSIAVALTKLSRLRAVGLSLGQKVYFNAISESPTRDYLANYYAGRVMMLDNSGNLLIKGTTVTATVGLTSVMTVDNWNDKAKKLRAKQRVFDPKSPFTWERKDMAALTNHKYRPPWLDKEIAAWRASYFEAKTTRQTHDYDAPPVKRGPGRPRKDGAPPRSKVKTADVSGA